MKIGDVSPFCSRDIAHPGILLRVSMFPLLMSTSLDGWVLDVIALVEDFLQNARSSSSHVSMRYYRNHLRVLQSISSTQQERLTSSGNHFQTMSNHGWTPDASISTLFERASTDSKWSSVNSSTAGPRTVKALPRGTADIQLYSLATSVSSLKSKYRNL